MRLSWADVEMFRRSVAKIGVAAAAKEIPAHRATIYRILRGDTTSPTLAVRQWIERHRRRSGGQQT